MSLTYECGCCEVLTSHSLPLMIKMWGNLLSWMSPPKASKQTPLAVQCLSCLQICQIAERSNHTVINPQALVETCPLITYNNPSGHRFQASWHNLIFNIVYIFTVFELNVSHDRYHLFDQLSIGKSFFLCFVKRWRVWKVAAAYLLSVDLVNSSCWLSVPTSTWSSFFWSTQHFWVGSCYWI